MSDAKIKEYYAFMRLADSDFDSARRSIKSLSRVRHPDTVSAIIRDSLISYARPFTGNRGIIKKKNLRLLESLVPEKMLEAHKKIMDVRNQIVAHTDVSYRKPMVGKIKGKSSKLYPISYKGFYYEDLLKLPNILEPLIKELGSKLWVEIQRYEKEHF